MINGIDQMKLTQDKLVVDDEAGELKENLVSEQEEDYETQINTETESTGTRSSMVTVYEGDAISEELKPIDQGRRYDFSNFHAQHWDYWTLEKMQTYRKWLAISLTSFIAIPVMFHGPLMIFQYATQWGIQMCLYQHALGYMAASRPDSYRWRVSASIMQELAICFNFSTCFVFWAVVAPAFFPVIPELWYRIGLALAHVLPLTFSLVHYYLNDNTMFIGDWWHTALVGTIYCAFNWMFTETSGEPVYPFLPWENFMSVFWCAFCTFVGIGCYWMTIMLTNKQRNRPMCSSRAEIASYSQELKFDSIHNHDHENDDI